MPKGGIFALAVIASLTVLAAPAMAGPLPDVPDVPRVPAIPTPVTLGRCIDAFDAWYGPTGGDANGWRDAVLEGALDVQARGDAMRADFDRTTTPDMAALGDGVVGIFKGLNGSLVILAGVPAPLMAGVGAVPQTTIVVLNETSIAMLRGVNFNVLAAWATERYGNSWQPIKRYDETDGASLFELRQDPYGHTAGYVEFTQRHALWYVQSTRSPASLDAAVAAGADGAQDLLDSSGAALVAIDNGRRATTDSLAPVLSAFTGSSEGFDEQVAEQQDLWARHLTGLAGAAQAQAGAIGGASVALGSGFAGRAGGVQAFVGCPTVN